MNETIKSIVAEMREYESTPPPRDAWLDLADRVEATARLAYDKIDRAVCSIEEVASCEIDDVRRAMDKTLGDYYE